MSKNELDDLERDVAEARSKLTADLQRLSSPEVFSGFKAGVSRDLDSLKQQALETTKEVARERAQNMVEMVTDRIVANPAAAAAIGAGLAWRLFRHPPLSTALVGLGLYGLLRSNGNGPTADRMGRSANRTRDGRQGIDWGRKAEAFAENARGQFSDALGAVRHHAADAASVVRKTAADAAAAASETIGEATAATHEKISAAASDTRDKLADIAEGATIRLSDIASEAGDRSRRMGSSAVNTAANWTEDGRRKVSRFVEDTEPRDAVLLGAAAVAIVTAIGLAAQRARD